MSLINQCYRFAKHTLNQLLTRYINLQTSNTPVCRIEEIDTIRQTVIIHCRGIDAPIKLKLSEAISDLVILANLSPLHASWIGYYYGKSYINTAVSPAGCMNTHDLLQHDSESEYEVIYQDRRGNIGFQKRSDRQLQVCSPHKLISDSTLINKFSTQQACFLGILAGIAASKKIHNHSRDLAKKCQLKLVKTN
jgi:hypothetical protein